MTFFEHLLLLLLASVVLLQVARRLQLPYPAMLAAAGVLLAFIPGTPSISFEPNTALALFIAPVILDAAFDFPANAALRFRAPLLALAVIAVLVTAGLVASLAHHVLGLSVAASLVLGAIVAPPDAAAATAVLNTVSIPRSAEEVLKGESLFNDATALMLYTGALAVTSRGALTPGTALHLAAAIPGGLLLGILGGRLAAYLNRVVNESLGANILQFVLAYLIWILAEHLGFSAVLCTIAFAMTIARRPEVQANPRMRVQSFAVWSAVVFTLNVLAFLIMGMQARSIVEHMHGEALLHALRFAAGTVLLVILARLLFVAGFNLLSAWRRRRSGQPAPPPLRQAILVGWAGMRGFVTLATAFALPSGFPQRDSVVLTAFAVVLGTLVVQGLTLRPLILLLKLGGDEETQMELATARARLAAAGLRKLDTWSGPVIEHLRFAYRLDCAAAQRHGSQATELVERHDRGLAAVAAERAELEELRSSNLVGSGGYLQLQEELDWRELTLLREDERRIVEN